MKKYFATVFARSQIRRADRFIAHPVETQQKLPRVFSPPRPIRLSGGSTVSGTSTLTNSIVSAFPFVRTKTSRLHQRIAEGERDVWPGRPAYFAKTSGTTSGTKYIPLTREGLACQVRATRTCCCVTSFQRSGGLRRRKMIFLQGSPVLENRNGILTGRLSGIVAHCVPFYLGATASPLTVPIASRTGSRRWRPLSMRPSRPT